MTAVERNAPDPTVGDVAKDVVRRYYAEVWAAQQPDRCDAFLAPDFTDHNPAGPRGDKAAAVRSIKLMMGSMSDAVMDVVHLIAEGDLVAAHWVLQWTQQGRFLGSSGADGARITLHGHDFYRVRDGRITDVWHCEDFYGVERRLRQRAQAPSAAPVAVPAPSGAQP